MLIGVPREPRQDETLVAATPDTVSKLIKLGYDVCVQAGAGERASYPDSQYEAAGAKIVTEAQAWDADIVTVLDTPDEAHLSQLKAGTTLVARMAPGRNPELVEELGKLKVTALAMDAVPRISRAQSMDVLSSMANVAGYRAIVEAAHEFGRLFTGQVTAAGKVPPATVYVIGAGVAGLAAIGTANSMGAIVKATDVRVEAAEQVESMGAQFVAIPAPAQKSEDGYAKEMSEEQAKAALKLYTEQAAASDIVITTANIPGRKSPLLITAEAVAGMKPGSVIVDMAAANGGNCELTQPGKVVTTENGVIIIGYTDLAGRLPAQSSQLYGQNIVNLLKLMTPEKNGELNLDLEDEIIRGICVATGGDILWPPPPISVSAAPKAAEPSAAELAEKEAARAAAESEKAARAKRAKVLWGGLAFILLVALVLVTPMGMLSNYIILALAIVAGFYVITNVTHSLHTPLMSETNAISGIILVGAILSLSQATSWVVVVLALVAIFIASINIFGGFFVTHRMLGMFRKED